MSESYRRARKRELLALWPMEKQMEALLEKELGRPQKLNKLKADLQAIRQKHPKR